MAPSSSNPPPLAPTVEEAYRRKCIQLKQRSQEIEEENDAYRLRLERLERQVQKLRLERAILLEQLGKRTSTNVEDSEGSSSPPPTPKDKPLRLKRSHRNASLPGGDNDPTANGGSFTAHQASPDSETFSHDYPAAHSNGGVNTAIPKPPKRPSNAFEIYCNDTRPLLQAEHKDKIAAGEYRLEEELARGWKDLPEDQKDDFQTRYVSELTKWKEERDAYRRSTKEAAARERNGGRYSDYGHTVGRGRGGSAARQRASHLSTYDDVEDEQDVEMGEAEAEEGDDTEPVSD
ncbi:putative HMG box-containing protein C10F6.08c [Xylariales sp. AK1849]|nr:putative HMG box-containing protein C10F6.08c [Xylariales sp. AK1849]